MSDLQVWHAAKVNVVLALLVRPRVRPPVVAEGEQHAASARRSIMHSYASVQHVMSIEHVSLPCLT